jgi:hypothetical protein
VEVSGSVTGNIQASEKVELKADGRMVGDIFAPRVIIVDGASFRGTVDMGDIENMPVRKAGTERPRTTPVARPAMPPRPAAAPAARSAPLPPRPTPPPPVLPASIQTDEDEEEQQDDGDDPPQARGLQPKQRARVVVKRR